MEVRGWPIEVRDLANRSEGLQLDPIDKSEGFGARLAQALSTKVRRWGGLLLANRSEGSGCRAGLARPNHWPTRSGTEHPCIR